MLIGLHFDIRMAYSLWEDCIQMSIMELLLCIQIWYCNGCICWVANSLFHSDESAKLDLTGDFASNRFCYIRVRFLLYTGTQMVQWISYNRKFSQPFLRFEKLVLFALIKEIRSGVVSLSFIYLIAHRGEFEMKSLMPFAVKNLPFHISNDEILLTLRYMHKGQ